MRRALPAVLFTALSPLVFAPPAAAGVDSRLIKLNDVQRGSLLLKDTSQTDPNVYVEAPLLETDVELHVTGLVVRATVRQRFKNPTAGFVEGTYAFPLSDTAAVDTLTVRVGERIIEGRVEEKKKAAAIYAAAKADGKIASLVEQTRPNLFITSVANIPAGQTVDVILGYQDSVPIQAGKVALRFPLAVTPRFTPPGADAPALLGGATIPFTDKSPPVSIDAHVLAGFPVARIASPSHGIAHDKDAPGAFHVTLHDKTGGDRDFVLEWDAAPLTAPTSTLALERFGDAHYALLMLAPPTTVDDSRRVPTDTVFVLDTSGSMAGPAMDDAKTALGFAIDGLPESARFNVVEFDDDTHVLFDHPRAATRQNKAEAMRVVSDYAADGGTMMKDPLEKALAAFQEDARRMKQVIFITDGAVSDEAELFAVIKKQLGNTRLFTVGIGAAPNSYFMRKAAEMGRGTFTYIGKPEEVRPKMQELFDKLESPVLSNLELIVDQDVVGAGTVELWPRKLPDLFVGEPLMVAIKSQSAPKRVVLEGMVAGAPVRMELALPPQVTQGERGIHKLWARRKIDSLTDAKNTADLAGAVATIEKDILDTALLHGIVSEFTSLVAVDVTPVRKGGEALDPLHVPTALPAGVMPRGATSGPAQVMLGALLALLAMVLISRERARA